jgi:hypothetical protein
VAPGGSDQHGTQSATRMGILVRNPHTGYTLVPPAVPLLIYGYVFGLGWVLSRQRDLLERLGSSWLMRVLIGLGAALLCLMIAEPQVSVATINDMQTKLTYAVLYAVAIVSLMFGFIGLGIRFFLNRHRLLEIYLILPTGCISHTFQSSWRYRFG